MQVVGTCTFMLLDGGAVNEIEKKRKNAVVNPCFSYKLNSSGSKLVVEVVCSTIREANKFFKNS